MGGKWYLHCGDVLRGEAARRVGDEHAGLAHHAVAHRRDLDGPDPARDAGGVGEDVAGLGALLAPLGAARAPAPAAAAHLGPGTRQGRGWSWPGPRLRHRLPVGARFCCNCRR